MYCSEKSIHSFLRSFRECLVDDFWVRYQTTKNGFFTYRILSKEGMFLLTLASLLDGYDYIDSWAHVCIPVCTMLAWGVCTFGCIQGWTGECAPRLKACGFQVESVLWTTCGPTVNSVSLCCPAAPTRGYPSVENLIAMHFQALFSTDVGGANFQ